METKPQNTNLGKTQITDKIRVSSADIYYESWFGDYWQFETWIFSDDKERQKSNQIIHGTSSIYSEKLIAKTQKVHEIAAKGLLKKFNNGNI